MTATDTLAGEGRKCRVDGALLGILTGGLILRVLFIESRGIWYDDAFSIFLARQPFARIISGTAADTMPPLYYFLLHVWMKLGDDVWLLRSLNVILSLGIVVLTYGLIGRLFGRGAGLWAAAICTASSFQVYHAQELRMYALLGLTLWGYLWFALRRWQSLATGWRAASGDWAGMVLCATAALYTHNLAIFTLAAPGIFLVLKRRWCRLAEWAGVMAAAGLLALPWMALIPGQIAKIQRAFWTPRPGVTEVLQAFLQAHANLPVPPAMLAAILFVALLVLVLVAWETRKNGWWDEGTQLLLVLALAPPALLIIASYLMRPLFVPRALIISMLAYYGLVARVAAGARVRPVGWFVGGALLAVSLASLPVLYTNQSFPRSPFRAAATYLQAEVQAGDRVIHDNKLSYFPVAYYAPGLAQAFLPDLPGSHNDTLAPASQEAMGLFPVGGLEEATQGAQRVYFVVFTQAITEYQTAGLAEHPALAWLDAHYTADGVRVFNDLEIRIYRVRR